MQHLSIFIYSFNRRVIIFIFVFIFIFPGSNIITLTNIRYFPELYPRVLCRGPISRFLPTHTHMTAIREDYIQSAVTFLRDPQVADASLAKKVEFLESKNLTPEEIEEALKRSNAAGGASSTSSSSSTSSAISGSPPVAHYNQTLPPLPKRDWKDYFVMATVSAGVAYGLYEVTRRYVLPLIMPPTPAALEQDKAALDSEFDRAEALLAQLQKDTEEIKIAELQRKEEFSKVLKEAQDSIEYIKSQTAQRETDMKLIKTHVESLRDTLPKAIEKHRDEQDKALLDLQEELKSLKQLLSNRMKAGGPPPASAVPSFVHGSKFSNNPAANPATPTTAGSATPVPAVSTMSTPTPPPASTTPTPSNNDEAASSTAAPFASKPGIPAWQLAAAKQAQASTSSS